MVKMPSFCLVLYFLANENLTEEGGSLFALTIDLLQIIIAVEKEWEEGRWVNMYKRYDRGGTKKNLDEHLKNVIMRDIWWMFAVSNFGSRGTSNVHHQNEVILNFNFSMGYCVIFIGCFVKEAVV